MNTPHFDDHSGHLDHPRDFGSLGRMTQNFEEAARRRRRDALRERLAFVVAALLSVAALAALAGFAAMIFQHWRAM